MLLSMTVAKLESLSISEYYLGSLHLTWNNLVSVELISLEQVQHNVDKHSCYVKTTQRKLAAQRKCSKIYFYRSMVTLLITQTSGMSLYETYKLSIVKITFNWARCSLRKNTRAPVVLDCTHFRWVKSVCSLPIKNALNSCTFVVADSRFPRGGANPKAGGSYFAEIISKLHENERNWARGRVQNFTM